jgi:hypothetical protein
MNAMQNLEVIYYYLQILLLKGLQRDENRPENSIPDVVMVQFDNYSGPPFIEENPTIVPIVPVERKIDCSC